jgi:uncharacterized protein YjbI with pentapeptide repeats
MTGTGDSRPAPSPGPGPASTRLFDGIDRFAIGLLVSGFVVLAWGTLLAPPESLDAAVLFHFVNWGPGLVTNGLLLLVLNHILRKHERRRIIAQVASLSNEFALDAVRRVRQEGWHADGSLEGTDLSNAKLHGADLSGARLAGCSFGSADLREAALHHTDLTGADLTAANLRGADLRWSRLGGAVLRWSDLRDALLDGAGLEGADLRGAALDTRSARLQLNAEDDREVLLSDGEAALLRRSFEELRALGTAPIEHFYRRLFELQPELRRLFTTDPEQQARKFMHSLAVIVEALDAPDRHMPVLRKLGARHAGYGVEAWHFELVTGLLIEVLDTHLGERFTADVRAAWRRGLDFISAAMLDAARFSGAEAS